MIEWRALSVETLAALSWGLGENSRIYRKINNVKIGPDTLLRAAILDRLNILIWQRTKDGSKGRRKPQSVAETLMNGGKQSKVEGFDTAEEFEAALRRFEDK